MNDIRHVMFVGDIHGDIDHWLRLVEVAKDHHIDVIVQVGDFGYWEHTKEGSHYLTVLNKILPCDLYFIDGNHDNHPLLWEKYRLNQAGPFMTVRSNIYYIQRGAAWTWGGVAFMGMGGAFSVDYEWRIRTQEAKGIELWWATEEIRTQDMYAAETSTAFVSPDILITHDAPDGAPIDRLAGIANLREDLEARSKVNRDKVKTLVQMTKPRVLIHGHFHTRLDYTLDYADAHCVSLGCEPSHLHRAPVEDSYVITDLELVRENVGTTSDFF